MSGERRKLPQRSPGGAPTENDLYCFLGVTWPLVAIPSPLLPFFHPLKGFELSLRF